MRMSFNNFGQQNDDLLATMLSNIAVKFALIYCGELRHDISNKFKFVISLMFYISGQMFAIKSKRFNTKNIAVDKDIEKMKKSDS